MAAWLAHRFSWRPTTDHIWLSQTKRGIAVPMTANGVRLMLERRSNAAGVNLSAHAFRRGFATEALRHGVSQVSVDDSDGKVLGHVQRRTWQRRITAISIAPEQSTFASWPSS